MQAVDVLGVGAGPSNMSLAALAKKTSLSVQLVDPQVDYQWHPGMLLAEAKLQVSHLKDLVTLADPTNPYSFLNYLHQKGCLYQFITANFDYIYRTEFSHYLKWVFDSLDNIDKGASVLNVEKTSQGLLHVETSRGEYLTSNLILGYGLTPYIPQCCKEQLSKVVFHNHHFLKNRQDFSGKKIAIIGGGQSGAEIVCHLLEKYEPAQINWFSKRKNFLPMDDSPFANELYTPLYLKYFQGLSEDERLNLLEEQRLTSDGISTETLEKIYELLYRQRFIEQKNPLLQLYPNTGLTAVSEEGCARRITIEHGRDQSSQDFDLDVVIICTGYRYQQPGFMSQLLPDLQMDGEHFHINADYSLAWKSPQSARIFMQNGSRKMHGVADANLSLMAYRSAKIINNILGEPFYKHLEGSSQANWQFQQEPVHALHS